MTDDSSPLDQKLAGVEIYTKLSLCQYDGSGGSNLTIALDSELIQELLREKPNEVLLLIAVMIDNPNSRQIVLE